MIVYTKPVRALTEAEYDACHGLNMGSMGQCRGELRRCRLDSGRHQGRAVMAWDEGELVGWGLKFRYAPSRYRVSINNPWNLYLYVDPAHRQKGIGRKIATHARMGIQHPIQVYPTSLSVPLYKPLRDKGRVTFASGYGYD